ncbi:hypothetical protein GWK08_00480 [Leptobacterium flavescens]|uniref:YbjN domain-containing protein n=2 Tax=Leptobacterium flavescens TaxID=472055 RepID=A0A6P0UGZ2_9FLAO|nr:hypothetical protein [Leptobacterium flavescens]
MTAARLGDIISRVSDSIQTNGNSWQFLYKDRLIICITDENANRMRIISPIIEREKLDEELLLNSLVANFHTALDVKYAISDEILWSVFAHPLKELTEHQVEDAISQVYYANLTFGVTFSSTTLTFPGNTRKKEPEKPEIKKKKIKI